ncbi:MAG: Gfo/Idh/MocA family oxidoreductase [Saprospiraceae bacterium]|nr:Gfo/Idh/MocA family oxidoreductase [Bacteroidia bacterium]NNE14796.1 Gfo/Idh/MocA family oxidoreductase [Saprospiraceae bacterium]NNL93453.1 Gfo/Idh/MocA family oxidoreductase [Saprospiraceae bacterium]
MTNRRDVLRKLSFGASSLLTLPYGNKDTLKLFLPEKDQTDSILNPITAIVLGAGNRGNLYGNYGLHYPEQMNIVGVAEPIPLRIQRFSTQHNIEENKQFETWEHVFEQPKFADAVIITTPDDLHYGPCMKALEMGYDVLLEKPIAPTEIECRNILKLAKQTGRIVAVCHVLRYAPYFMKLRELVQNGSIGELISVQHFEPIEHIHMSHSYVRGNWHNSKKTTPIILAKSCHDLDILRWIVGKPCNRISAFGNLKWFTKSNMPEGATPRCMDGCLVEKECPYSAMKIYYRNRQRTFVFDLPTDPEKQGDYILEKLRTTDYGRCVYQMENDQPDHYIVNMEFESGITSAFSMEAFTSYHGRRTRIMGSHGDIVGDMTKFQFTNFITGEVNNWEMSTDGHGGGDWKLAADWIRAVSRNDASLLSSTIDDSIESHIMGFMAEKSRKEGNIINVRL